MYLTDTIAAIATPPGVGGVGIIRVSGPEAIAKVSPLFRNPSEIPLEARATHTIHYGHVVDGDRVLDEVLLLIMRAPRSYTTEDVVEIQCHGGIVPVRSILSLLLRQGVRMAEPGEFTQRAFLNGRIDLTQAEAIIDLIEAKTEASSALAMKQLEGGLGAHITELRQRLIALIAHLEVTIDYPEEDIEERTMAEVQEDLQPICEAMERLRATARTGRLLREGVQAAIVGLPNAGKSSLLNALLRTNRAIVTDIPGTTRDALEEYMNVEGITVRLVDTAGIRETEDVVEQLGVERAQSYLSEADLVLLVIDASTPCSAEELQLLQMVSGRPSIVFLNKKDLGVAMTPKEVASIGDYSVIASIAASAGEGSDVLADAIRDLVLEGALSYDYDCTLGNVRHIELMERAYEHVLEAMRALEMGVPIEYVATDLRSAWTLLGDITGASVRDDMSAELFQRFCLGK